MAGEIERVFFLGDEMERRLIPMRGYNLDYLFFPFHFTATIC